tara:strand:- start:32 stop:313 length:282 start_codon:yes stop_codon:yes gene_type:complete
MNVYWREHKTGQRLMLESETGQLEEVGGVRRTSKGFDALARTMGYEPGRAQKGFSTIEDAKSFVESFHPWDIFIGTAEIEFDEHVHPLPDDET